MGFLSWGRINFILFDQTKSLLNIVQCQKYLIVARKDEGKDMSLVSPFLLITVVSSVVGEVDNCMKLRNGTVVIYNYKKLNTSSKKAAK